ncbi:MAG: restriction endonuclease [Balneolales bacterium]|nr:restriction endonuclease [Balneolales bacterium]
MTRDPATLCFAQPGTVVSREDVMAFRGSLHVYGADDGAIIGLAGFEKDARSEAIVPNLARISLIDATEMAEHLIRCGVGVAAFRVDVNCIDDVFFRDFEASDR